ncbi:hypothetical protein IAU60_006699 [Kwoniella sp. DSM 27419]
MSDDFLGHQAARPGTALPGRWVVELPSVDTLIHVKRYEGGSGVGAGPSGTRYDLAHDAIEAAWRGINDGRADGPDQGKLLEDDTAIISSEDIGGATRRILWMFSTQEELSGNMEGLQEVEPRLPPIEPARLVTCTRHSEAMASCFLGSSTGPSMPCEIALTSDYDLRRQLDLLGAALAEKMAWRSGQRIVLKPASASVLPPFKTTLRPLDPTKLLLSLHLRSHLYSRQHPSQPNGIQPLLLSPLLLPAIKICAYACSAVRENKLAADFDRCIGPTWKEGRVECRLKARLRGEGHCDWSVYWVPLDAGTPSVKLLGKLSPRQLIERWQRSPGVLTIWPTHLSEPYYMTPLSTGPKHSVPLLSQPETSELLDLASGAFDFLSTYREPPPEEVDDEAEVIEEDVTLDGESTVEPPSLRDDGVGIHSPNSDLDDLFSAHSDSPAPEPIATGHDPVPAPVEVKDEPPLSFFQTLLAETDPNTAGERSEAPSRNGTETREELQITEDDFAFFDSPTDQMATPVPETGMDRSVFEKPTVNIDDLFGADGMDMAESIDNAPASEQPGLAIDGNSSKTTSGTEAKHAEETDIPTPRASPPVADPRELTPIVERPRPGDTFPPTPSSSRILKRKLSTTDLIPDAYLPLTLLPAPGSPFVYYLPTPASTPSDLREELVERLRPQKLSQKSTYADAWDFGSEPSVQDEEEHYTGPPTPESFYSDSTNEEPRLTENKGEDEMVEFGGRECVGAEWVQLLHAAEQVKEMSTPWSASWGIPGHGYPPTPPAEEVAERNDVQSRLKGVDWSRFIQELVANRSLRRVALRRSEAASRHPRFPKAWSHHDHVLEKGCASLTDLSLEKCRSLPQPSINVGYSNSIARMAISSLHYWSELGLQPQGGPKSVEAVIVCEDNPASRSAALSLYSGMKATWEALRLGNHSMADVGGADQGVVAASLATMHDAVANLLNQAQEDMLIYVLLPAYVHLGSEVVQRLFSSALDLAPTTVVHIVHQQSISPAVYDKIALEVYDQFCSAVRPITHRSIPVNENGLDTFGSTSNPAAKDVPAHAFTLDRRDSIKPEFSMSWPLRSYDIMNNHRCVHVHYTVLEEVGLILAAAVDDRGQAFDLTTWADTPHGDAKSQVKRVWEWARGRADEWAIEWRMSLTRVGSIAPNEIKAWKDILNKVEQSVTLLVVDEPSQGGQSDDGPMPRTRATGNVPQAMLNDVHSKMIDLSLSAQLSTFSRRFPLEISGGDTIYPEASFLSTVSSVRAGEGAQSTLWHVLFHQPSACTNLPLLDTVVGELGEDMYRLTCLMRCRHGLDGMVGVMEMGSMAVEAYVSAVVTEG